MAILAEVDRIRVSHEIQRRPPEIRPSWSVGNPAGPNPLDAKDYWILPEVSGEGVRITVIRT